MPINIEVGRYNGIERELRVCNICVSGEVENEVHFLLKCVKYEEKRGILLSQAVQCVPDFNEKSDIEKIKILTTHNNLIRKTCKFIKESLECRNSILRVT